MVRRLGLSFDVVVTLASRETLTIKLSVKPPPTVSVRSEYNLLVWSPQGVLDEKAVNRIISFIGAEEAKSDSNRLRFIDTSGLTAVDLNFRYVFHVALYRRLSREGRPAIKSAFLVKDSGFAHYFELHALLTDHSPLQVKLFDEREDAAEWLEVPVESLQMA